MFFARQFPYFAQSVTLGSLCHGNNCSNAKYKNARSVEHSVVEQVIRTFLTVKW